MEINDSSRTLAKGAGIAFIGMSLGKVLSYIYTIVVSRIGPEDYGLFNLGLAIVGFVSTLSIVGLRSAILRYIPYYKAKEDHASVKGVLVSSLLISLFLSILFTVLILIFSPQISIKLFHEPRLIPVLGAMSITIILFSLSNIFIAALTAFKKVTYKVLIKDLGETLIEIMFLVIFFTLGYNLSGAIAAYIISILFTLLSSFYVLEKKVFPVFKNKIKSKRLTKEIIFYSLPLVFTEFLVGLIKWISTWMLGIFRTVYDIGVYNVAMPTVSLLVIAPTALMTLFAPLITEMYSKSGGDMKNVKDLTKTTSRWIFMLNFPIFVFLFTFSKNFLDVMFKPEYIVGSLSLSILSVGFIIYSLSHVYTWILLMLKKTKTVFMIMLISTVVSITLNYLLIKPYGFLGAAIATSLTFIILTLIYVGYGYIILKVQPLQWNYFKNIFAALISVVITYFFPIAINSIITLLFKFIIFGVIYLIMLYLLKSFHPEDEDIFNLLINKLKILFKF